ncbi:MauE/DoxX family redox-associated membrane protein [Streptomyces sp. CA-250714]|uniref:MauE/DoxX family redox-associated membrane protein n=1 Tax=Streptomyces sp. CA-250714 TaxID=3240060 RepID=UPI003D9250C3
MVLRIVLGTVLMAMATGQLASLGEMPDILAAYRLVTGAGAAALAGVLITGELVSGAWFLTRPRSMARTPVWAYTAVALMWSALALQAYVRELKVDNCGCFGRYLTQSLSWIVLVQDALMLLYAGLLLRVSQRAPPPPGQHQNERRQADERRPEDAEQ